MIESAQTLKRRMGTEEQLVALDHQQILESKHTAESCEGQPDTHNIQGVPARDQK